MERLIFCMFAQKSEIFNKFFPLLLLACEKKLSHFLGEAYEKKILGFLKSPGHM